MRFEWDPTKAVLNRRKHRVSFAEACRVFLDKSALSIYDGEHSQEEERWVTMGEVHPQKVVVVAHTYRESGRTEVVRIISARKATARERKLYRDRKR